MYDGWLTVAGVEVVNKARLVAYRDALLPGLDIRECGECHDLAAAIGDDPYTDPVTDEAPWYDPDTPGSDEFLGFHASSLSNFEDSTATATVSEGTLDGGTVGKTRRATREMRVSGVLLAASQAGASAGLSWLKATLDGNLCNNCDDSDDICFFTACPRIGEDPDDFIRHIRRVKRVAGPTVLVERPMSCGGYMIQVEFTLVAGSPYVYGEPVMVAAATGAELTPIFPGSEVFDLAEPILPCFAALDKSKQITVIRDPDCPVVPVPPTVPTLSSPCKPIDFSAFDYPPNNTKWPVKVDAYNSRPVVARKPGSPDLFVCAFAHHGTTVGQALTTSSVIYARTSTDNGQTWSADYTLYDEGSGGRGVAPAGITWAPDLGKFIMGVTNINFGAADGSFDRYRGEILTSTTGLTGSWSVLTNLDTVMRKYGMKWYYLTDVEHHEDGTANGITYAVVWGLYKTETLARSILLRSMDGAATWQVLHGSFPSTWSWTFPQLAVWPDGTVGWFMYVPQTKVIWFRRSEDGGRSFSTPVVVATAAEGIAAPVVTNDGTIMVMHADVRRRTSRNLGTHLYRFSRDRGRTWTIGQNFADDTIHGDMGADWCVRANGDLLAVYSLDFTPGNCKIFALWFPQIERYLSYAIGVPDSALRAWADGVMLLQVRTGAKPTRQMRVRLVPRPFDTTAPEDLDPCSICSGFIIDYAPANTLIYMDGMTQRVTMAVANGTPSPADHLVSGENGNVFEWPTFSCGVGYFVVIDIDVETIVDVALAIANRE